MKPEDIDKEVTTRVPVFIGKDSRYFNNRYQIVQKKKKWFWNSYYSKHIKGLFFHYLFYGIWSVLSK